jgi:hypothetical protein
MTVLGLPPSGTGCVSNVTSRKRLVPANEEAPASRADVRRITQRSGSEKAGRAGYGHPRERRLLEFSSGRIKWSPRQRSHRFVQYYLLAGMLSGPAWIGEAVRLGEIHRGWFQ